MILDKIHTSSAAGIEISVPYLGWLKLVFVQINVNTSPRPLSIVRYQILKKCKITLPFKFKQIKRLNIYLLTAIPD